MPSPKARSWAFTIPNAEYQFFESSVNRLKAMLNYRYILIAEEVAPSTGLVHGQGVINLCKPMSMCGVKQALALGNIHLEPCKGNLDQNITYCKKGAGYTGDWSRDGSNHTSYGHQLKIVLEEGTPASQGTRTDLDRVANYVINGKSLREIATEEGATFAKYAKGLTALRNITTQPRQSGVQPTITVFFGATGSGKTRKALSDYPEAHVQGPDQGKWFDGYDQHQTVVFDEFRAQITFGQILRLTDRYPCKVEVKGGMMEFVATNIVFTAPTHPINWYKDLGKIEGKMKQFRRRITKIVHFDDDGVQEDVTGEPWASYDMEAFVSNLAQFAPAPVSELFHCHESFTN